MFKKFRLYFLLIFLLEILSLIGFLVPEFRQISFFVILFLTLIVALKKLEYGLLVLLAELFVGSKGYLFYFEHDGLVISIRIAIFLIIMSMWLGRIVLNWMDHKNATAKLPPMQERQIFLYFGILFLFIAWGLINGYWHGNSLNNIFFDFNGWLYFGILFPATHIFRNNKDGINNVLQNIFIVFAAAVSWLITKTLILTFIFSHDISSIHYSVFRWIRTTGVGEITYTSAGFYRIFFQSHVYVLVAVFVFLALWFYYIQMCKKRLTINCFSCPAVIWTISLWGCIAVIVISFSRSFWVGLADGLLVYFLLLLIFFKKQWKAILWQAGSLVLIGILSIVLIFIVVRFPYPEPLADFSASMLADRVADTGEAGASSRWNLLPPLKEEIKKYPIMGKGFGSEVTYISNDPRVRESSPTGEYTTYAFEWGWLDIWLKLGFLGMLAYVILLWEIFLEGYRKIQNTPSQSSPTAYIVAGEEWKMHNFVIISLLSGLIVIISTTFFSPYLNHPLGIGYVVLAGVILGVLDTK